jgi:hypothetical protein
MTVKRSMTKVMTEIVRSRIVGQSVAGVTHACASPAISLFFVRKYFVSA